MQCRNTNNELITYLYSAMHFGVSFVQNHWTMCSIVGTTANTFFCRCITDDLLYCTNTIRSSQTEQAVGGRLPRYAPAPLLRLWAPKRRRADRAWPQRSSSFPTMNTFPRSPLQLPDALTPRWVKRPGDLDLWTLKLVSESRVTWATCVPICVSS